MLKYAVLLPSTFKSWLHGLQFDLGLFFLILRPLIAVKVFERLASASGNKHEDLLVFTLYLFHC